VQPADVPAVAGVLARAFEPNPGMRWAFPDAATRLRRMKRMFATMAARVLLPRGECTTTAGFDGAALWLPPGEGTLPLLPSLALLPRLAAATRGDTVRVLRFMAMSDRLHPHEPHWYLALLGVEPELHGRGYGSHLMAPVLERCDRDGVPAYLETDTPQARALYERHGFHVTAEHPLPGDGPPVWLMWRPAD
jgi:ribosomal protein S18 acetylase RimI-like enzyme